MIPSASTRLKSYRAPMLWLVLPWSFGLWLAASGTLVCIHPAWLLGGASLLLGAGLCLLRKQSSLRLGLWQITFGVASVLVAVVWWRTDGATDPSVSAWRERPARECELLLEVESVTRYPRWPDHSHTEFTAIPLTVCYPDEALLKPLPERLHCHLRLPVEGSTVHASGLVRVRAVLIPPLRGLGPFRFRNGDVLELVEPGQAAWIEQVRQRILNRMMVALDQGAPQGRAYSGYLQSMLTGDTSYLAYDQKQRIRRAGVMHFFAISGFHLSVIALMSFSVLQLARIPTRFCTLGMLAFSGWFVWLTGNPVSAQRAWIMLLCYFLAKTVFRKPDALASTSVAAMVVLWLDSSQLFTPGFQLSFLVVIGILTQALPLQEGLSAMRILPVGDPFRVADRWTEALWKVRRYVLGAFAVSWTAFWMSAPVVASAFGSIPFAAVVLNTLLVPLFALVLITACLSAGWGVLGGLAVSGFFNHAAWLLLSGIDGVLSLADALPLTLSVGMPSGLSTAATLVLLGVGCGWNLSRRQHQSKLWLTPIVSLVCIAVSLLLPFA